MTTTIMNDLSGQWTGQSKVEIIMDSPQWMSTTTKSRVGNIYQKETYLRLNSTEDKNIYEGIIYCDGPTNIKITLPEENLEIDHKKIVFTGSNIITEIFPSTGKRESVIHGNFIAKNSIHLKWFTRFAQYETTLYAPHSENSPSTPQQISSWDNFKKIISSMTPGDYIFRGQKDHLWRLRTSFFRSGGDNFSEYFNKVIPDLRRSINSISDYIFSTDETSAILNLAQHHGFPTPLIDWTESPYVAAYFAFRGIETGPTNGLSKIYILNRKKWNSVKPKQRFNIQHKDAFNYLNQELYIDFADFPILNNSRATPQQALVGITNIDDIEAYFARNYCTEEILQAFTIPHTEREYVLRDLNYMGINAATLFPGLDGLCEKFKNKYF